MWKEIKNYEGYYEVSADGQVRSLDRKVMNLSGKHKGSYRFLHGKIMKQTVSKGRDGNGYLVVNLRKSGKSCVSLVHVLVAEAFIPNPFRLPTVNHKDGNKHNNHVDNLEWSSYSDNNTHALRSGLRRPRGIGVVQYSLDGIIIATYKSACEASRTTGISRGAISHCLNGMSRSSGGYVWKKLSESQTTITKVSTREDELPVEAQRPSR